MSEIQSLARGLKILDLLSQAQDGIGITELAVLLDVGERRERVPDVRSADAQRRARAVGVAALAVGLAAGRNEVPPADPVLV